MSEILYDSALFSDVKCGHLGEQRHCLISHRARRDALFLNLLVAVVRSFEFVLIFTDAEASHDVIQPVLALVVVMLLEIFHEPAIPNLVNKQPIKLPVGLLSRCFLLHGSSSRGLLVVQNGVHVVIVGVLGYLRHDAPFELLALSSECRCACTIPCFQRCHWSSLCAQLSSHLPGSAPIPL